MSKVNEWQHLKIPYKEIEVATENFKTPIGRGGYGCVYKGKLLVSGKETMVAIKRLNEQFGQGLKEFLTEIQLLSGQRHPNLITLLGYCDEGKEKTIVYEYAERGSLDQYLRRSGKTTSITLTWLQRLKICADAARGLDHLHSHVGGHRTIIHRDIKSSNILIDENWVGMISDLGLSKLSVSGFGMSDIVSNGCGTQGYCEPEYYSTGVVTKKSDVFSFGVVLFEVLCGRLCLTDCDGGFSLSSISAKKYYENNRLDMIIDHSLKEHIGSNSMTKFAAIAYRCLHNDREQRPAMDVVVKELEEALRLLVPGLYVRNSNSDSQDDDVDDNPIDPAFRLMFFSSEGNIDGIKELIESNTDVNFKDDNDRTALHVAACQGFCDVANLLLEGGAEVDSKDRWGSTPLADAVHYKNHDMVKLLEKHGAKPLMAVENAQEVPEYEIAATELEFTGSADITNMAPMPVKNTREVPEYEIAATELEFTGSADITKMAVENAREVPEYEIAATELEFTGSIDITNTAPMRVKNAHELPVYEIAAPELDFTGNADITKGTFTIASWRGTKVAVKKLGDELITNKDEVRAFRDEVELLQKIRHPNVVQILGAVTQSNPMMIVTEYLPKGDLHLYLKRKGALKPITALKFAMDIAWGMNYLHENKPEPIIHRDLEPSNILRADSGQLKVADFGISELLKVTKTVKQGTNMSYHETTWRYVAPEVFKNEDYDTKVDVFSFALILQEMIEGNQPFFMKSEDDVPKAYVANERPPFNVPPKSYAHGLRELIEECWHEKPDLRPTFREIITRLESIYNSINRRRCWKVRPLRWFQKVETIWKKEDSVRSSRDSSSHI